MDVARMRLRQVGYATGMLLMLFLGVACIRYATAVYMVVLGLFFLLLALGLFRRLTGR